MQLTKIYTVDVLPRDGETTVRVCTFLVLLSVCMVIGYWLSVIGSLCVPKYSRQLIRRAVYDLIIGGFGFCEVRVRHPIRARDRYSRVSGDDQARAVLFIRNRELTYLRAFCGIHGLEFKFKRVNGFPLPVKGVTCGVFVGVALQSNGVQHVQVARIPPPGSGLAAVIVHMNGKAPDASDVQVLLQNVGLRFGEANVIFA